MKYCATVLFKAIWQAFFVGGLHFLGECFQLASLLSGVQWDTLNVRSLLQTETHG